MTTRARRDRERRIKRRHDLHPSSKHETKTALQSEQSTTKILATINRNKERIAFVSLCAFAYLVMRAIQSKENLIYVYIGPISTDLSRLESTEGEKAVTAFNATISK